MTADDLIRALGGTSAVADGLSVKPPAVSNWRKRGTIPAEHWAAIVDLASRLGRPEISFEALGRMHASEAAE